MSTAKANEFEFAKWFLIAYIYFVGLGFVIRIRVWLHVALSHHQTDIYSFSTLFSVQSPRKCRSNANAMAERKPLQTTEREKETSLEMYFVRLRRIAVTCCLHESERKKRRMCRETTTCKGQNSSLSNWMYLHMRVAEMCCGTISIYVGRQPFTSHTRHTHTCVDSSTRD